MSSLMIRCPKTGQNVWTGIETDLESLKSIPDTLFYAACPQCGFDHAWWPKSLFGKVEPSPGALCGGDFLDFI